MINPIGPHTSVEIPQAANAAGRATGAPARSRDAALAGSETAPGKSAGVMKTADAAVRGEKNQQKLVEAAQEFEAVLLSQILKTARESSGGWLGAGEGQGMTSTMELAETQLAQAMAEQGALGIGKYLAREFTPHASPGTKPSLGIGPTGTNPLPGINTAVDGLAERAAAIAERIASGVKEGSVKDGSGEQPVAAATSANPHQLAAPKPHASR